MLFKTTVEPATLELLKSLQNRDYLKGFNLVGGTAMAFLLKKPSLKWVDVKKFIEKEVFRFMKELT